MCLKRAFVKKKFNISLQNSICLYAPKLGFYCSTDRSERDLHHSGSKIRRELDKRANRGNYAQWLLLLQV